MTRQASTLVFVLVATLANILVTGLAFILLLVLYGLTLGRWLQVPSAGPALLVAFLASILISAFIYKKALAWASTKWHLEEKLGLRRK